MRQSAQDHPLDVGEDTPTTLPFPGPRLWPVDTFALAIPPSSDHRLLCCQVYSPAAGACVCVAPGQTRHDLSNGEVLVVSFAHAASSSLTAATARI